MKKVSIYIVIIIAVLAVIIGLAAYAMRAPIVNVENMNTSTYLGGQVSLTTSGGGSMSSSISTILMSEGSANNKIEVANNTLNVTLTTSNDKQICCSYDIVWEWDQTNVTANQYSLTSGATKEFTLSGSYSDYYGNSTADTLGGSNISWFERQLQNYNASARSSSMTRATICNNPTQSSKVRTHSWNLATNFYNLNINQDAFKQSAFSGKAKVANVSCTNQKTLADYLASDAPRSGIDAVSSSPWILTSDHSGEWRYAGKNPDNYIDFNGELWRIIGVMPDMTYCTGEYGNANECNTTATGSLVKIIRNDSLGNFIWDYKKTGVGSSITDYGSNDWSDSQLQYMLNGIVTTGGGYFYHTGYDINNNLLHTNYKYNNSFVIQDINNHIFYGLMGGYYLSEGGTTVNVPSAASTANDYTQTSGTVSKKIESSALSQIATVKWDLYGTDSYTISTISLYDRERNINNTGAVYSDVSLPENRPVYWYGKVGLMYPSDYGYASNGNGSSSSTYSREDCIGHQIDEWDDTGDYKTYCALNDWLIFNNVTSTPETTGMNQWTITPGSSTSSAVFRIRWSGPNTLLPNASLATNYVRPVLYLKADTTFSGGTGTYDNPYRIDSRYYWFAYGTYTYPNNGGTLYASGSDIVSLVYIGQDTKHYACATIQNQEICLSQPYTQYGLKGHTVGTNFTTEQQNSIANALKKVFADAGVNINTETNCYKNSGYVDCYDPEVDVYCGLETDGSVYCGDDEENFNYCYINPDGTAQCE